MNEMTQLAGHYASPFKTRYDNFIAAPLATDRRACATHTAKKKAHTGGGPFGIGQWRAAQRLASSAATMASPISVVEIGVSPSLPNRSAVRSPSASTFSTAFSTRVASSPMSKE